MLFQSAHKTILAVDWDETATVKDTTGFLADLAAQKNPRALPFSHYSAIYSNAHSKYYKSRNSVDQEIAFQKGLFQVEMCSIHALENDRYFSHITQSDLVELAGEIELQPGFVRTMQDFAGPKYIVSVNWCRTLIEMVLRLHGLSHVRVWANDFVYDASGTTTGTFEGCIRTGYDKWSQMKKLRNEDCNLVYVGDSAGDVLPIVMADVGIIIDGGRGISALECLVPVEHVTNRGDHRAYYGTWSEIGQFLLEMHAPGDTGREYVQGVRSSETSKTPKPS